MKYHEASERGVEREAVSPEVKALAQDEISVLQKWRGKSRRLGTAFALMTVLAIGRDLVHVKGVSGQEQGIPRSEEKERLRSLFQEISETYKTFDIHNKDDVEKQLQLYENNWEVFQSLPDSLLAELKHQFVFTKIHAIGHRYGIQNIGTRLPKVPDRIRQDQELIRELNQQVLEMDDLVKQAVGYLRFAHNADGVKRTGSLHQNIETIMQEINSETPEALRAKQEMMDRINRSLSMLNNNSRGVKLRLNSYTERFGGIKKAYVPLEVFIDYGSRERAINFQFYYNPSIGKVEISKDSNGILIFVEKTDPERTVIQDFENRFFEMVTGQRQ